MKSVAIVGFAVSSRDLANSVPPDEELWCLNDGYTFLDMSRGNKVRWFQLHSKEGLEKFKRKPDPEQWNWLKTCDVPAYMIERHDDIPTSIEFPLEEIVAKFGRKYFSNTIAYMLALAMLEGFERIRLYGADISTANEYIFERPCIEYWLGRAEERGIELVFPEGCPLLWSPLYGRESAQELRLAEMARQRCETLNAQYLKAWASFVTALGQFRESAHVLAITGNKDGDGYRYMKARNDQLIRALEEQKNSMYALLGSIRDAQNWAGALGVISPHLVMPDVEIPEELEITVPKLADLDEIEAVAD